MSRIRTGLRTAIGALTTVPVGALTPDPAAAVPWYPWVGTLFGLVALGIASFASPWVQGSVGTIVIGLGITGSWAALSGLLHWDGLADTVDALWGGGTPEERLEIMRDSRVGAFGAFAVALGVMAQVTLAAVAFAGKEWTALFIAPVAGRFAASFMAATMRPARAEGLGASAKARPLAVLWAAVPLVAAFVFQALTHAAGIADRAAFYGFGLILTLAVPWALSRPIKGYTGDTLGASVVIVETAVLAVAAVRGIVMSAAL